MNFEALTTVPWANWTGLMTSYNHLYLVKHGLVPINQRISEYKFQEGSEMSLDKGGSGTLTSQIRKLKPKLSSELATLTLRIS